jgi:hypothetical protein
MHRKDNIIKTTAQDKKTSDDVRDKQKIQDENSDELLENENNEATNHLGTPENSFDHLQKTPQEDSDNLTGRGGTQNLEEKKGQEGFDDLMDSEVKLVTKSIYKLESDKFDLQSSFEYRRNLTRNLMIELKKLSLLGKKIDNQWVSLYQQMEKVYQYTQLYRVNQKKVIQHQSKKGTLIWQHILETVQIKSNKKSYSTQVDQSKFEFEMGSFTEGGYGSIHHAKKILSDTTDAKHEAYIVKLIDIKNFHFTEYAMLLTLNIPIEKPVLLKLSDKSSPKVAIFMKNMGLPFKPEQFETVRSWDVLDKVKLINNIIDKVFLLHALGIIHGDIKGANLLFSFLRKDQKIESIQTTLIDLGAGRYTDNKDQPIPSSSCSLNHTPKEVFTSGTRVKRSDYFPLASIIVDILKSPGAALSTKDRRSYFKEICLEVKKINQSLDVLSFKRSVKNLIQQMRKLNKISIENQSKLIELDMSINKEITEFTLKFKDSVNTKVLTQLSKDIHSSDSLIMEKCDELLDSTHLYLLGKTVDIYEIDKVGGLNVNGIYIQVLDKNKIMLYSEEHGNVVSKKIKVENHYINGIRKIMESMSDEVMEITDTSNSDLFNKILSISSEFSLPNETLLLSPEERYKPFQSSIPLNCNNLCDTFYLDKTVNLKDVKKYIKKMLLSMSAENVDDRPPIIGDNVKNFFEVLKEYCEFSSQNPSSDEPYSSADIAKLKLALISSNIWSCSIGKRKIFDDRFIEVVNEMNNLQEIFENFSSELSKLDTGKISCWMEKEFIRFLIVLEKSSLYLNPLMVSFRQHVQYGYEFDSQTMQVDRLVKDWGFEDKENIETLKLLIDLEKMGFFFDKDKVGLLKKNLLEDQDFNVSKLAGWCKDLQEKYLQEKKIDYTTRGELHIQINKKSSLGIIPESSVPNDEPESIDDILSNALEDFDSTVDSISNNPMTPATPKIMSLWHRGPSTPSLFQPSFSFSEKKSSFIKDDFSSQPSHYGSFASNVSKSEKKSSSSQHSSSMSPVPLQQSHASQHRYEILPHIYKNPSSGFFTLVRQSSLQYSPFFQLANTSVSLVKKVTEMMSPKNNGDIPFVSSQDKETELTPTQKYASHSTPTDTNSGP